jgi:hypothetical protein
MNTGHDGSLTTIHSNSSVDAIGRITVMALMADTELPERAIREQIGAAIDYIVQIARFPDGTRKVTEITELRNAPPGTFELIPIFRFQQTGCRAGEAAGEFIFTGNTPSLLDEARAKAIVLPGELSALEKEGT